MLVSAKKKILFVSMDTGELVQTFQIENNDEETYALQPLEEEYGLGLYITKLKEKKGSKEEFFLIFHYIDLEHASLMPFRRIRYPGSNDSHCIANSLNTFIYVANNSIVHAVIDNSKELKITMLLDGKLANLLPADVDTVYKMASYHGDDFLIYFKRKSTGEVLYFLTHEETEIATEPVQDDISDLAFNDGQIERSDIVALKNKFTFVRITINNEERRSAIGEIGNFDMRFPWICYTSFGGYSYNFLNVDEVGSTFRLDFSSRMTILRYLFICLLAVCLVAPWSVINKSEVQFLVDHDSYLVYHKVRLSDAIEIVLYRRHIYPEKCKISVLFYIPP